MNYQSPVSKHLATVLRKNSLLTGRDVLQKHAQGVVAICHDRVGGEGEREEEIGA